MVPKVSLTSHPDGMSRHFAANDLTTDGVLHINGRDMPRSPPQDTTAIPESTQMTGDASRASAWPTYTSSSADLDVDLPPLTPIRPPSTTAYASPRPDPSVSVSSQTRSQPPSISPSPSPSKSQSHVTLSTRLYFLSSLAASEQHTLPSDSSQKLHAYVDIVQRALTSSPHEPPPDPARIHGVITEDKGQDDKEVIKELRDVLKHLTESISTLRQRHDETLHLQSHLIARIRTFEATNSAQITENDSLRRKITDLELSNHNIQDTAEDLRDQVIELEAREEILEDEARGLRSRNAQIEKSLEHSERTALEDQIALEAMSATVGGLEGWLDGFVTQAQKGTSMTLASAPGNGHKIGSHSPHSVSESSPLANSEPTVRGHGRFRGKYNVQSQVVGPLSPPATPSSTNQLHASKNRDLDWTVLNGQNGDSLNTSVSASRFHQIRSPPLQQPSHQILDFEEGVRSWIKGFKDVEDTIRTRIRGRGVTSAFTAQDRRHIPTETTITATVRGSETDSNDPFDAGDGTSDDYSRGDEDFGAFQQPRP